MEPRRLELLTPCMPCKAKPLRQRGSHRDSTEEFTLDAADPVMVGKKLYRGKQ